MISYWFILSNQAVYLASFIYSIYSICVGSTDPSTWSLPFLVAFPTNTLCRWYSALFFETNIGFAYSLMMVATTSFFVCGCLYICAICDHCCFLIKSIDADNERVIMGGENPAQENKLHKRINEKSIKSIKMHVRAHEWVFNSVDCSQYSKLLFHQYVLNHYQNFLSIGWCIRRRNIFPPANERYLHGIGRIQFGTCKYCAL